MLVGCRKRRHTVPEDRGRGDPRVVEELRRQARDIRHSYDSIQHHMGDQLERARRFYRGRR